MRRLPLDVEPQRRRGRERRADGGQRRRSVDDLDGGRLEAAARVVVELQVLRAPRRLGGRERGGVDGERVRRQPERAAVVVGERRLAGGGHRLEQLELQAAVGAGEAQRDRPEAAVHEAAHRVRAVVGLVVVFVCRLCCVFERERRGGRETL